MAAQRQNETEKRRRTAPRRRQRRPEAARENARAPRRGPRRRGTSGTVLRIVTMLAAVAAVVMSVVIFFQVHTIYVDGNAVYSREEILQASGLKEGDNLLTLSKPAMAGRILAALPYVEKVQISRVLPDTVAITVTESQVVFSVTDEAGGRWLINSEGKVLEQVDEAAAAAHPAIAGITAKAPAVGAALQAEPQESLDAALQILGELEGTGILPQISGLNVEKLFDILLWYGDRYEIKLGGAEDLSYKISYLAAVLDQLDDYQTGIIDLTFDEKRVARFLPQEIEKS